MRTSALLTSVAVDPWSPRAEQETIMKRSDMAPWRARCIENYVGGHLHSTIKIADLARVAQCGPSRSCCRQCSGPHFRDYHLLLDEQADQLYAMTDPIAERIRKTGGSTLPSIRHIARVQRIKDNEADYVEPVDMLAELREDSVTLSARLREVHEVVDELRDIATASLIEN
jgi:hypothetical protein